MRKSANTRVPGRPWWSCLALALCLLCAGSACAFTSLSGAWRPVRANDTPSQVWQEYVDGQLATFDPNTSRRLSPSPTGTWVVLAPKSPWNNTDSVLSIDPAPSGAATAYMYGLESPQASTSPDFAASFSHRGHMAWLLKVDQTASLPILLKLDPPATRQAAPVRFTLQPLSSYLQQDTNWLIFAGACLAVMLAMTLMALCFALMLRDVAYAWYAACVLSYALLQGIDSGFVFHPLQWQWLVYSTAMTRSAATVLLVAFAALFITRFCNLSRHAPLLRVPVLALAAAMIQLVLLRASQLPSMLAVESALFTPLLTLGVALLLLTSIVAAVRGSRRAWFFVAGLAPLLLLTAANHAQFSGALTGWTWLGNASLAVGALEAVILSIGVADHALSLSQSRDEVRVLADRDALTDVFNRRGWTERASAALATSITRPMALLFLDLDHFKTLNDQRGHHCGDSALIAVATALAAELRPQDLLGRYGGEEFVVLLDTTAVEQAAQVATRLCRRIYRLEIPVDDDATLLTISIGVAMHTPADSLEALIARADQAMYSAKLNGRNQVCVYQFGAKLGRLPNLPARRDSDL